MDQHDDAQTVALYIRFSWVVVLPGSMRVLSQSSIFGHNPKIWCRKFNDSIHLGHAR
jgi:hypothetical protein